jgi:carboxypeptidase Taq
MSAYDRLTARFARVATIAEAQSMLGWDAAAMMPEGGGRARGDQLAVLAGIAHAELTAPETAEALAEATAPDDPWPAANLALMRHAHLRAISLPADLVEAATRANTACEQVWRGARADSDFARVRPLLVEVVRLARQQAACLSEALGLSPYDALMDGYQRGIGAADVAPIFAAHAAWLRDALPRAEALQAANPPPELPAGPYAVEAQEALCRRLAEIVGLEPAHFRLDRSAHPFCGGTATDVRITTRYDTADATTAAMGVLHECGHALYERGLPAEWARQPVGEASGMAAHESQSLIVEMQACRSDGFLGWLAGRMSEAFGRTVAPAALAGRMRAVRRGWIRVDADEMTYPAHIILRFELEQALISGDLAVADLPGAWNDGMRRLLDTVPPDDRRGCLQDIHWYDGGFGYFPSYSLGAMAAAQLMAAARRATPDLDAALARGDMAPLLGWLRANVHRHASRYGFNELLTVATGRPLDVADFQAHLARRYLGE